MTGDGEQVRRLIDQAADVRASLSLTPGIALTDAQVAALDRDILWYVETVVDGERVLVPRLYLADASRGALTSTGALIAGASVDLKVTGGTLTNTGSIVATQGDLRLSARDGLSSIGGLLKGAGDVSLTSADGAITLANKSVQHSGSEYERTVRMGRAAVEAGRDLLVEGAKGVAVTGADLGAGRHLTVSSERGAVTIDPEEIRKRALSGWRLTHTYDSSVLRAGGDLTVSANDLVRLKAADLSAEGGLSALSRYGDVQILAALERDYTHTSSKKYTYTRDIRTHRETRLQAGQAVSLTSGRNLLLEATRVTAGGAVALKAGGGVGLLAVTDSSFLHEKKTSGGLVVSSVDRGHYHETVRMVEIAAAGPLSVEATLGVAAQVVRSGGSLTAALDAVATRPGLEWVAELRARDDVAWSQIEEAHRQWEHKSKSINPVVGMVVSLAVAAATGGAGAPLLGLEAGTLGAAMANAAFTSIASQAATSLIVNGGDLGAVFRDLTSTAGLRALAMSVATAGLMHEAVVRLEIDLNPETMTLGDRIAEAGARAGVGTIVDTAIGGEDLGEALKGNLVGAAVGVIGAEVAQKIGLAAHEAVSTPGAGDGRVTLARVTQIVAHGALGCAMGAATGGGDGCASGAVGGAVGEAVGLFLADSLQAEIETLQADGADPDSIRAFYQQAQARGVSVARLSAALAAAAAGLDPDTAAQTGGNAADNNAFFIPLLTLAAGGLYATAQGDGNPLDGLEAIGKGEDPLSKAIAAGVETGTTAAVTLGMTHYPDETTAVLGVVAALDGAIGATLTYIDDATGNHVSAAWNSLDEVTRNRLKGGVGVVSVALSAGSVQTIGSLVKVGRLDLPEGTPGGRPDVGGGPDRGYSGGGSPTVGVPNTSSGPTINVDSNGNALIGDWSSTRRLTSPENALGHWNKHRAEFPEYTNASQYVEGAQSFVSGPPPSVLTKTRNGDTLLYDPASNIFAVRTSDGLPRTMFRPTDGIGYWTRQ